MSEASNDSSDLVLPTLSNGRPHMASVSAKPEERVELGNLAPKLPLHEDVMQLARLGEIGPVQKLLNDGKIDIRFKDEESITPLHVRS